ncbi:hypothetical protein [Mycobacterium sp.]|uniref:hypothetical protein n=1 Tax=Mycobacterium sp. TaxID=1785 RepID=UPI002BC47896|nr:hypothetical protein [Mycobacterium sp.]HME50069.1 hypothetical protein [Mycobacterium sp.]
MPARRDVTRDTEADYDEHAVQVTGPKREAAGVRAVLVSLLDHVAAKSNTPVSKAIVIRLEPAWAG